MMTEGRSRTTMIAVLTVLVGAALVVLVQIDTPDAHELATAFKGALGVLMPALFHSLAVTRRDEERERELESASLGLGRTVYAEQTSGAPPLRGVVRGLMLGEPHELDGMTVRTMSVVVEHAPDDVREYPATEVHVRTREPTGGHRV